MVENPLIKSRENNMQICLHILYFQVHYKFTMQIDNN